MRTPPRTVLDTNVFVSGATISEKHPLTPAQEILAAWRAGNVELATSPPILSELARVLHYDKVQKYTQMSDTEIQTYIGDLAGSAIVVPGTTPVKVSPDPDDDKFFACALEAQADYIVSGDQQHVLAIRAYKGIQTISP